MRTLLSVLTALLATAMAARAETPSPRLALAGDVGTLGFGLSAWYTLSPHFTVTSGYNGADLENDDVTVDGTAFANTLKMRNVPVWVNYHPFAGKFRVFAGAVFSDNKAPVQAKFTGTTVRIGDLRLPRDQVGELAGEVKIGRSINPLLGFGWSSAPTTQGFGVYVDIGVVLNGETETQLNITGPAKNDPTYPVEIAKEAKKVTDELNSLKTFPLFRLGVTYRF